MLPEAEGAAAENPSLRRYRIMLADCLDELTPALAHLMMARWCHQQIGLTEQARFHWFKVLERSPGEPEALDALGLCRYQGELASRHEGQTRNRLEQGSLPTRSGSTKPGSAEPRARRSRLPPSGWRYTISRGLSQSGAA